MKKPYNYLQVNHKIIHEKILYRTCLQCMSNKTIVSCQPPLRFFHSTELWLPVFQKLKTLSLNEKLGGQRNYFLKMSVFNIQLDEIKNMNSVTSVLHHLLPLTTFLEVVLFCLKVVLFVAFLTSARFLKM